MLMGDMSIDCKLAAEDAKRQEEQLNSEVRSLLVAGTALSVTRKQLLVILVYTYLSIIHWVYLLCISDQNFHHLFYFLCVPNLGK